MNVQTMKVPHLGGIDVAYRTSGSLDASKPTLVLVHSFMTSGALYDAQLKSEKLKAVANMVAVDLLGHGDTRAPVENFTYWDSAIMILQLLDTLKVNKFFALGTSQGGWIVVRMALLAPNQVRASITNAQHNPSNADCLIGARTHPTRHINGLRVGKNSQTWLLGYRAYRRLVNFRMEQHHTNTRLRT